MIDGAPLPSNAMISTVDIDEVGPSIRSLVLDPDEVASLPSAVGLDSDEDPADCALTDLTAMDSSSSHDFHRFRHLILEDLHEYHSQQPS